MLLRLSPAALLAALAVGCLPAAPPPDPALPDHDHDQDGYTEEEGDCDDNDIRFHPGASDDCEDGIDHNCDRQIGSVVWYLDGDGDGFGDPQETMMACEKPSDHVENGDDCDDDDAEITSPSSFYLDNDHDGYGDPDSAVSSCEQITVCYVQNADDCDDDDEAISPAAAEVCDDAQIDEDCSGAADDDDAALADADRPIWFFDGDGDGLGDPTDYAYACHAPSASYVVDGSDCDDADAAQGACGWLEISMGDYVACGIRGSGRAECWGSQTADVLRAPPGAFSAIDVSTRDNTMARIACAIRRDDQHLVCWGESNPDYGLLSAPKGTFQALSIGLQHACALRVDGSLDCWGTGAFGSTSPPEGHDFVAVSAGDNLSLALTADGELHAWGYASMMSGVQLPEDLIASLPQDLAFVEVAQTAQRVCALDLYGELHCTGDPELLEAGDHELFAGGGWSGFDIGKQRTCVIDSGGAVACSGDRDVSYNDTFEDRSFERLSCSAHGYSDCGILDDSSLTCWGQNIAGEASHPE